MKTSKLSPILELATVVLAGGVFGCAQTTTHVFVEAPTTVNEGAPMHMMVRAIPDALTQETYEEVAAKMFVQPQDASVVLTQPVFPGERTSLTLPDVEKNDVVIYFFFTTPEPKDGFRVPLRKPLPAEVFIELGEHKVERVQVRQR